MTANADIVIEERQDVLRLPNAALRFRPADPAVAAKGQAGVTGVIETMRRELRTSMALIGRTKIADIDASVVQT